MSGENHQELFRRGADAPASRMLLAGVVLAAVGAILFVVQTYSLTDTSTPSSQMGEA